MAVSSGKNGTMFLDVEEDLWRGYCFWLAVVMLKMVAMSFVTAAVRMKKGAAATPEDARGDKLEVRTDETVERIRRAHQNDLENIPAFGFIALAFLTAAQPSYINAMCHFRVFAVVRIAHSVWYSLGLFGPVRSVLFLVGVIVNVSMAVQAIVGAVPQI